MIMTNNAILKAIKTNRLVIENFSKACLFQTSYNLRLGKILIFSDKGYEEIELEKTKTILINPKAYFICRSFEKFKLDNSIHGVLGGKSDLIYKGLIVTNGLTIDPTFEGYIEFGFFNALDRTIKLAFKEKVAKAIFFDVSNSDELSNEKWLPKEEKRKWDLRNLNKFALEEMDRTFYQGG